MQRNGRSQLSATRLDLLFTTASKRVCGNDPWTKLLTSRLAAVRGRLLRPMAVPLGLTTSPKTSVARWLKPCQRLLLKQIGNAKPDLAKDLVNHLKSCATTLVKPGTHTAEAGADDKASSEGAIST